MMNATIPLEYFFIGVVLLLLFSWNPRIFFTLFKVAFCLALYAIALPALYRWPDVEATREAHMLGSLAIPLGVTVLSAIIFAVAAYFIDRSLDKEPEGRFKGGRLFQRYGKKAFEAVIPIPLNDATPEEADHLLSEFWAFLWDTANRQFGELKEASLTQRLVIKDLGWTKEDSYHYRHGEKVFFKMAFQTARRSTVYYFIHLSRVGSHLLAHHYGFRRGRHFWYHALEFFVTAPFHVWFWGYPWIKGRYSILGRLNRYHDKSSFSRIDLRSYFTLACFSMMTATRQFAKVYGLLSDELERQIWNDMASLDGGHVVKKGLFNFHF